MTDQWNPGAGPSDAPARNHHPQQDGRSGRPRRSTGDRKIAGVAGGLGRAFGVDPILIRVAFVVLTIFGGFGGLLYVLGWLLLSAEGDEVSAAEALLGRGRSSVAPVVTVGLAVVAVISALSMFSWGLPFLPLAIGGVVTVAVLKRRSQGRRPGGHSWGDQVRQWHRQQDWGQPTGHWDPAIGRQGGWSRHSWGQGPWSGPWDAAPGAGSASSPFQQPAFWEKSSSAATGAPTAGGATTSGRAERPDVTGASDVTDLAGRRNETGAVDLTKRAASDNAAPDPGSAPPAWPGPDGEPRTTPPAWDPLGAAPFAWDLPEPSPLPGPTADRSPRSEGVALSRIILGATLLAGGLTSVGVFAGWWAPTWAQVSGIALAVLALGLLIAAVRGRGYSLLGPGIFLSLVTLALAVTGIKGTSGYGAFHVAPTIDNLQSSYTASAGDLDLDLSGVSLPSGSTRTLDVMLRAGYARVVIPDGVAVTATCSADVGHTDCLGKMSDGVRQQSTDTAPSSQEAGKGGQKSTSPTLMLNVHVNAGFAEVTRG